MGVLYGLFVATMFMLLLHGVGHGVAGWLTPLMVLICVVALIATE